MSTAAIKESDRKKKKKEASQRYYVRHKVKIGNWQRQYRKAHPEKDAEIKRR